ncbi:sulfatase-like hydrolase/transferase [Sulfitobacter sp. D35]|uniref:sulfatase-like hydrolase/transferase n=1 Tax=Sulfitobacter sp. D35 TaxID=3083252 RepID=UPI00296EECF5|nr:sulfatase-like hydrolase/transferase [Sulfitobacter sp. D35]MDW4497217.1 sulfatase-like hydrolase/transferase [Sulfitobacter sp. D35]
MTHPNILLVTADQWPGALFGVAGRTDIDTPSFDQLARNGIRFVNAFSECPICIPARRSMMTGTAPREHGDREFQPSLTRPDLPHLAEVLRDAGYQTAAVGKLHVYPSRDRIGFEETVLYEEGRPQLGGPDDWELWLTDRGQAGLGHAHGMSNNGYEVRTWHLDEESHPTVWLARQACRTIQRRDPTRPMFLHLSFNFPHPPIVPLRDYLDAYRDRAIDPPVSGDWTEDMPHVLQRVRASWPEMTEDQIVAMRRAFYAQCTLIDHQFRLVVGTLREQLMLDDTIILFTSDHGEMLGDHGLYAKRLMLGMSASVPMFLMGVKDCLRTRPGTIDMRLAAIRDIMPTLLDLAGVPVPESCTGRSLVSGPPRETLYCEALAGAMAMRMVTDGRHKLIWYPAGNRLQLFDCVDDPQELHDLSAAAELAEVRDRLTARLIEELYGEDLDWVRDGALLGFDPPEVVTPDDRGLHGQRGIHFPQPPAGDPSKVVGAP